MDRFQNTRQPDWDWWGKLWPTPGATLRKCGLSSGHTLAEVGSGNGYFALPAARIVDPAPVYAVDVDPSLLEALAHLADQQNIKNIETVAGDARSLTDHLPEPVDVCLVANAFHGIEASETFVTEAVSALAADGRLVVINWQDRPREETTIAGKPRGPPADLRLAPSTCRERIESAADITLAEQFVLPPYHYALVFE
ncbi:probable S-adenosylmethionine-dependent methyltransferase [Natronomonas pharaonis DSM 2160]|uniref:Probable S-adenosylmethionine-dependent methyltransferase n=1 Tax=Natronomonas pharaonis (strain ATCC 35678 / DSM 2160 / CIP 103997 / JCM 8858 / NBRC 14720 / NCIMB 2260 / Gabara) TaxID=348780 RepID=A0A1U7EXL0_NATPD|nr:class I SAM-dependent methyltransferase [Natronomonas pharaonis]CAI49900.1 probable S-adenosylmethionine-dependent methyltransferase [Natronomonas pharaonis DSM 2160]